MTTHGMSGSKEYRAWGNMRDRCCNPKNKHYKDYGGRGIKICDKWMKFEGFYEDMGKCPEGKSIDRIDNDGNYEPGNCRWATNKTQNRNQRKNRMITFQGKTKCLTEWADDIGVTWGTLHRRLMNSRWSMLDALTTPRLSKKNLRRFK